MSLRLTCDICGAHDKEVPSNQSWQSDIKPLTYSAGFQRYISWDVCNKCREQLGINLNVQNSDAASALKEAMTNMMLEIMQEKENE
jgi:hypothetical protein